MTSKIKIDNALTDEKIVSSIGTWSMICTILLLLLFSYLTNFNPLAFFGDFISIFLGNTTPVTLGFSGVLITGITGGTVALVISLLSLFIIPKGKSFNTDGLWHLLEKPRKTYIILITEEAFRYLVVIILGGFLHAGSSLTVILMVIANILWSLVHFKNYEDKKDWKLLAILPQFLSGLIYGYLLIRFGFLVALIAHLTDDFALFSSLKKYDNIGASIWRFIYWIIVGSVIWFLMVQMGLSFSLLAPWVMTSELVLLDLTIWQMAVLLIAVEAVLSLLSSFLFLDPILLSDGGLFNQSIGNIILFVSLGIAANIAIIYGLSWLISWIGFKIGLVFLTKPFINAITVCLVQLMLVTPTTGSSMARVWFFKSPGNFLAVFTVLTFGFWTSLGILIITAMVGLIPLFLEV